MDYGKKLKEIRKNQNYSQADMAKFLEIDRITYSHYETQEKIVPLNRLNQICNCLHVSLDFIFNLFGNERYEYSSDSIDEKVLTIKLKELRKNYKISQVELAKKLNIGNGTIAGYETGRYLISTHVLYAICKKYNISADYLLGKIDYIPDWCNKNFKNE